MNSNAVKLTIAAVFAVAGSAINLVGLPFGVLCILMCADYCTGLAKSWQSGTLSSHIGAVGFIKKLGYGMAVVASAGVDYVVAYGCQLAGNSFEFRPVFVLIIIGWLIINECISILENISQMGVPLPSYLLNVAKKLKSNLENKGDN